ncbi:WD40-repeat-containing domain protein [Apiosordaria backusii]|uniref:WD40-repeat-containing domain protein n=1 Tax=Apiosordaria backusii TaxID=314023 RepID=A0AA40ET56_9PEZI|nr:WD40-repeat-containing domain protein [Apiosordaria backusii]
MAPATQFEVAQPPNDAISSLVFSNDSSHRLLVSSWDKHVYLYEIVDEQANLINKYEHRAPVLDACFGANNNEAFTAGVDQQVKRCVLNRPHNRRANPPKQALLPRPLRSLLPHPLPPHLRLLGLHPPHPPPLLPRLPPLVIPLPGKPHALSSSPTKLVVAMTARLVHIYDLPTLASATTPPPPWQTRESSLKFLTRAVACMPNDAGYATSSIEGRVAVEWFEDTPESQARKYAFKCHRQAAPEEEGGGDIVYPVNALAFHPVYGTFASGGGDGTVALWDAEAKRRMRQYQKFSEAVAAMGFSGDGKYLAIGVCPGFETGMEDYTGGLGRTRVFVRELGETEAKGKGAK